MKKLFEEDRFLKYKELVRSLNIHQLDEIDFTIINSFLSLYGNTDNKSSQFENCLKLSNKLNKEVFHDSTLNFKKTFNEITFGFDNSDFNDLLESVLKHRFTYDQHNFYVCPTLRELITYLLNFKEDDSFVDIEHKIPTQLLDVAQQNKIMNLKLSNLEGFCERDRQAGIINMALAIIMDDLSYLNTVKSEGYKNLKENYDKAFNIHDLCFLVGNKLQKYKLGFFDKSLFSEGSCAEWIGVDQMLSHLNKHGRAISMVYSRPLFNDSDKNIRNYLVDNGLLEGIIELPKDVFGRFNTTFSLLIFSENNAGVKLVNAAQLFMKKTIQSEPKLFNKKIIELYENTTPISNDDIKKLSNWNPSVALIDVEEPTRGIDLEKIADILRGCPFTATKFKEYMCSEENSNMKIITPIDIEYGKVNFNNSITLKYDASDLDKFAIQKGDIIITSKTTKIKLGFVNKEPNVKTLAAGGMLIVRLKDDNIRPLFLMKFLESERGQKLLKSIQRGATVITISVNDLKKVKIPYSKGELQEQINLFYDKTEALIERVDEKIKELLFKKEKLEKEMDNLINKYFE